MKKQQHRGAATTTVAAMLIMAPFILFDLHAQTCSPPGLNSGPIVFVTNGITWNINYSSTVTNSDVFPAAQANLIPGITYSNLSRLNDDFNFKDPWVSSLPNFNMYCFDSDNIGTYRYDCITIDSPQRGTSPEPRLRKTLMHEQFHAIQSRYQKDEGLSHGLSSYFEWWYAEGTARFMDDRLYDDTDAGTWGATFWDEVANNTLVNPTNSLFDLSYGAALFWSYCAEQFGGAANEPERGYPFVRKLWQNAASEAASGNADDIDVASKTIRDMGGPGIDTTFHDYTIANLVQGYNSGLLDAGLVNKYTYIDQFPCCDNGGPAYGRVAESVKAMPYSTNLNVRSYAAAYHTATFVDKSCELVGVYGTSDKDIGFAAVGRTGASGTNILTLAKGTGKSFARAFIVSRTNPITRITGIASGLDQAASVTLNFDSGPYTMDIIRPTFQQQVYPGPYDDPDRILVRVKVSGPASLAPPGYGNPSVLGLQPEQFRVLVGTQTGSVFSATYVGGEYWLSVQAPVQLANGLYDLKISLCEDDQAVTEPSCVQYGDFSIDHVVVIDNSGSMDYPDSTKLDAAKAAAKLYIDATSTNDRIAAVRFSGNNSECDMDAFDLASGLLDASSSYAATLKAKIDAIGPDNMTSIGDGLWKAQDILDAAPPPPGALVIRTMCLLTDGMENEERYWDQLPSSCTGNTVKARIMATGTVVQAIALGADADQALMQDIGLLTGGDYTYVDLNEGPATASLGTRASLTSADAVFSYLSKAYVNALTRNRGLQQIIENRNYIRTSSSNILFVVTDDFVKNATFHFSWSKPLSPGDAGGMVELYDPNGNPVTGASALVRTGANHKVYQLKQPATNGTYTAVISSPVETELYSGLFGKPSQNTRLQVFLHQVMVTPDGERPELERFLQGQPIQILAVLDDRYGPLPGAEMVAEVIKPDGKTACFPTLLYDDGNHGDGAAGDGVYGALFTETDLAAPAGGNDNDASTTAYPAILSSYRVHVAASGKNSRGVVYALQRTRSFQIFSYDQKGDADADGLPDTWELYYTGSLGRLQDANKDTDEDGLPNIEEFRHGTHPLLADTDQGGELDGSEVLAGRCPVKKEDDAFPAPVSVHIVDETGCGPDDVLIPYANVIHFPRNRAYRYINIEKATSPAGSWSLLAKLDLNTYASNQYVHAGLSDGVTYYYRVYAENNQAARSPYSRVVKGTAKKDPVPPRGWIKINHDNSKTDSTNVLVTLDLSGSPAFYRISSKPINGSETLRTITTNNVPFGAVVRAGTSLLPVHVVFYDAAMNASYMYSENILFDPDGNHDADAAINKIDTDDDDDGLSDFDEVFVYYTDPFNEDSDGDGLSDFDETTASSSSPSSVDTDGDGLTDQEELDLGTDPANADDDGDGMPDGWEASNGLDPKVAASDRDSDGDGMTDFEEYLAGTNPGSSSSRLTMMTLPPTNSADGLVIEIPTSRGRRYHVQNTSDLSDETSWFDFTNFVAESRSGKVNLPTSDSNKVYRVILQP